MKSKTLIVGVMTLFSLLAMYNCSESPEVLSKKKAAIEKTKIEDSYYDSRRALDIMCRDTFKLKPLSISLIPSGTDMSMITIEGNYKRSEFGNDVIYAQGIFYNKEAGIIECQIKSMIDGKDSIKIIGRDLQVVHGPSFGDFNLNKVMLPYHSWSKNFENPVLTSQIVHGPSFGDFNLNKVMLPYHSWSRDIESPNLTSQIEKVKIQEKIFNDYKRRSK